MVYMARKERREEAERLAKVTTLDYSPYQYRLPPRIVNLPYHPSSSPHNHLSFLQAAEAARIEAERLAEEERLRLLALVGMKRPSFLYQSTNILAIATNTI